MTGARLTLLVVVAGLALGGLYVARAPRWDDRGVREEEATTTGSAFEELARSPMSARSWLQLGDEAQRQGKLPLARAAFRAAQEIAPDDGTAHARLGFVLYEEGDDQAALEELRRAREKGADAALLDFTLSMMRAHVDTAGPFPRFSGEGAESGQRTDGDDVSEEDAGAARVAERNVEPAVEPDLSDDEDEDEDEDEEQQGDEQGAEQDPRGRALAAGGAGGACELLTERKSAQGIFLVSALVNGVEARLIVDTGASLTVLSRDFLADTGLVLEEDGVLTARTAAGPQRFVTAGVREVEIGGRVVSDVRVAICEDCGMPGSDGLLGLDVQEPLGMSLFPGRGTVRFADCFQE